MADYITQVKPGGSSGTAYNLRATMKSATFSMPASGGSGWSGTTYGYSNSAIKANSIILWTPASTATAEMVEAMAKAQFIDAGTIAGKASIKALGALPTIACNVTIYWMGQTE